MTDAPAKNRRLNFETVGSIAAMVIGASALFVAWDQSQVMRAQQHASVWPLLDYDFEIGPDADRLVVRLTVKNAGVGPALIESADLLVDGKPAARWSEIETTLFNGEIGKPGVVGGSDIEESVLAPGDSIRVLQGGWPGDDEQVSEAFRALANSYVSGGGAQVAISLCYCSVFDHCWRTHPARRAERVSKCPEPTRFFEALFDTNETARSGEAAGGDE